jgi:hypothetical protein
MEGGLIWLTIILGIMAIAGAILGTALALRRRR